jgi:putative hemolysin
MRYRLSAAGAVGVIAVLAVLAVTWAVFGHFVGESENGGTGAVAPNAVQESLASEAAPACGDSGQGDRLGMANPAATYCKELGYEYRITQTSKGEQGVCVFPDSKECEEWKFLAGRCGQERSYCAKQGLDIKTKTDGKDSLSREYAECTSGGAEVGSVGDLMGLSQKATRGSIPLSSSEPPQEEPPITGSLPSSFDWRDQGGENWMTSVKDQGSCGSCWAFSAVGVVEGTYNIESGNPDLDLNLSEEYLVSDCYAMGAYGNCCGGMHEDALEFVRDSGIPDDVCMPYVDGSSCTCSSSCDSNCTYGTSGACSDATCSDRCSDWQDRTVTIDAVAPVPSGQIKQYLVDKGPLSVAMGVGTAYGGAFDAQGVYRCASDSGANHAVIIAGYSDVGGYWIVKNSWGTSWPNGSLNDGGYFKVGYGECTIENWVYYVETPTVCPGDGDCDGVLDAADNCPAIYNPDQSNSDGGRRPNGSRIPGEWASNPSQDKMGDACDPDDDNDGLPDSEEFDSQCPWRLVADSDGDTVLDGYEVATGYDPCSAASKPPQSRGTDSDADGLRDALERSGYNTCALVDDTVPGYSTCTNSVDSDEDGCADVVEVLDLNGDRQVNVGDQLALAILSFGAIPSDPVSDKIADLNKDGDINVGDDLLMALNTCDANPRLGCPTCPAE